MSKHDVNVLISNAKILKLVIDSSDFIGISVQISIKNESYLQTFL